MEENPKFLHVLKGAPEAITEALEETVQSPHGFKKRCDTFAEALEEELEEDIVVAIDARMVMWKVAVLLLRTASTDHACSVHERERSPPRQPGEGTLMAPPPTSSGPLGRAVAWLKAWAPLGHKVL